MKKNKLFFGMFIIFTVAAIVYGSMIIVNNINDETYSFTSDGYAVVLDASAAKANVYSFNNGTEYNYKKYNNNISFESNDENIKVDDSTVIHYQDKSLLTLKNVVGLDLENISNNIIFYYNIYKNTTIKNNNGVYSIKTINEGDVTFKTLLIRVNENKYLLAGSNVRMTTTGDEIVEFGNYAYIEYLEGSIVQVYNDSQFYRTVSDDSRLVCSDISINLNSKEIYKENVKYITLSNLVINMDSNVDAIIEEEEEADELQITKPNVPDSALNRPTTGGNGGGTSTGGGAAVGDDGSITGNGGESGSNGDGGFNFEGDVVEKDVLDEPVYKVTKLNVTALKVEAEFEIEDKDSMLTSATEFSIVENSSAKVVYSVSNTFGDLTGRIVYLNLKPDTEYTLYAKANYKIDEVEYNKTFISKIFRTENIGVYFQKSYATTDSITIDVFKEKYSKVTSLLLELYTTDGVRIDYSPVDFGDEYEVSVDFEMLDSNTTYMVKMTDLLSDNVIVSDGYSQRENVMTLKKAPVIGDLEYTVNKYSSTFDLNVSKVVDEDYGVLSYKYDLYDVKLLTPESAPLVSIEKKDLSSATINVDDNKVNRGVSYTYRLNTEFYDNEKTVVYTNSLESVMSLDGVAFPTLRFEPTYITWEQINGVIVIDDPSNVIVGSNFKVVYKNSVDKYDILSLKADTLTGNIPITINNLRANETYTFDVLTSVNIQDNNEISDNTLIGCVKVQTGLPNPLSASFVDNNDYTSAFSFNVSLSDFDQDASFEASTMSDVVVSLFKGEVKPGEEAQNTLEISRNLHDVYDQVGQEYVSSLKEKLYDSSLTIDPKFFKMTNTDFTEGVYTFVISDAKDYTSYKNDLPIDNSSRYYRVEINSYVPELPENPDDSIRVEKILNRFAENYDLEYRADLNPNTVIGYSIVPDFLNNTGTAVDCYLKVFVYDPKTKTYLHLNPEKYDKVIPFKKAGPLEPYIYELQDGVAGTTVDTDEMRRGNEYYFTFEVSIDFDKDGEVDAMYPQAIDENVVLRSVSQVAYKQSSRFRLYPATSGDNIMSWRYNYSDIDNAISDMNLYAYNGNGATAVAKYKLEPVPDNNTYNLATFNKLKVSTDINIKKAEITRKGQSQNYVTLTTQYLYPVNVVSGLKYVLYKFPNRLSIELENYYKNIDIISKIVSYDLVINPVNNHSLEPLRLNNLKLSGTSIDLYYYDIKEYLDEELSIDLIAHYDTGRFGYEMPSRFKALQGIEIGEPGRYIEINSGGKMTQTNAIKAIYDTRLDINNSKLILNTGEDGANDFSVDIVNETSGIVYEDNNIIPKEISDSDLSCDDKNIEFNYIIPAITMMGPNRKYDITALLDSATLRPQIQNYDHSDIKDNIIYIEVYETDSKGTNAVLIDTKNTSLESLSNPYELTDLLPQHHYYVKFYCYVKDNSTGTYKKEYLYDLDSSDVGVAYRFNTLANVNVSNVNAVLVEKSYSNKYLKVSYSLDSIEGYDHISYKLYVNEDGEYVPLNVNIPNDTPPFYFNMNLEVDASPGSSNKITYGGSYKIVISPVGYYEVNGVMTEFDLGTVEYSFTIDNYTIPYIGISPGKNADSIFFRVSVADLNHVLYNDRFDYKLVNSNYEVIASRNDIKVTEYSRLFTFKNEDDVELLKNGETYRLIVTTKADYKNNGLNLSNITASKTIVFGDLLSLGSVTADQNAITPSSIDIRYLDSYKLDTVATVTYSISNTVTSFYYNGNGRFVTEYDANSDIWTYTIPVKAANFQPGLIYVITVNYYDASGSLLLQDELNYYYGGAKNEET